MMMKSSKCSDCRQPFTKFNSMQKRCLPCAILKGREMSLRASTKLEKEARKADRIKIKARLEGLKRLPDYIRETQIAVNRRVLERDRGLPCISCGAPDTGQANSRDAGHYRSRGSAPHLRFDARNIFAQCKRCNRYLGGNAAAMRVGMVQRIGLAEVEALEADNDEKKWTREELQAIKAERRKKLAA